MRSRRLPGAREIGRPAPMARTQPALFDGETIVRRSPAATAATAKRQPPRETLRSRFGVRTLLLAAVTIQIAGGLSFASRIILALEYLSLHPGNMVPLAALGAVATGLAGWAWWFRQIGVAAAFCACSVIWWLILIGPSL